MGETKARKVIQCDVPSYLRSVDGVVGKSLHKEPDGVFCLNEIGMKWRVVVSSGFVFTVEEGKIAPFNKLGTFDNTLFVRTKEVVTITIGG